MILQVIVYNSQIFIRDDLFEAPVDLEDRNTWRNLCEPEVAKAIMDAFKKSINALTVRDQDGAEIIGRIRVAGTRPFVVKQQVKKSASEIYVVETKGRVDEDVPPQMDRLKQWCEDATEAQRNDAQRKIVYDCLYVDEDGFRRYIRPGKNDFSTLVRAFQE